MVNQRIKKRALHRAKIIRGQLDGLINAVDQEEYCTSLLHQSFTIQQSLKSLDRMLLENHLETHVVHQLHQPGRKTAMIKELLDLYNTTKKAN